MTLGEELDKFYQKYNIPKNGGLNDETFDIPFPLFTLKLPNFSWRKKMLYIHDLEHILNKQDTSWRGEMYIASWEIATGFWRNFPIILFPLWTMGWGLWKHPKAIMDGFNSGCKSIGIANLGLSEEQLLALSLAQLEKHTHHNCLSKSGLLSGIKLICWIIVSQMVFLFPLLLILLLAAIFI